MKIDAIFFDIDDTLFSTSEFARRARENAVDAMRAVGLSYPREEMLAELEEVVAEFSSNYHSHFDKLLLRIPKKHYKGLNTAIIIASGIVAYHETKARELEAYPDALELLARLPRELLRGVITAGLTVKQAEKLIRLGVYGHLTPNAIFISDQIGVSKPNVKLYQRACSDLNLKPTRSIYIGDNAPKDVDPPNSIGMITVHLKRGGKHNNKPSRTEPDHTVADFRELAIILERDYDVPMLVPAKS